VPKPVKFSSSVPAEGPVCGSNALDLNVYALAVSQIPFVKPRVIVKAKNAVRAKTIRTEMREELEKRMEPGSITWLNTKSVREGVELWLVPEKRTASELSHLSAQRDIERYSEDIKKYPNDPDAYMGRAKAFEKVDRSDEAIEDLTQAIVLSKHPYYVAQATTDRGEVYLKRGRYLAADADFSAVIGLTGADAYRAGAYLNRARSQSLQGKRTEALKDANEAIRLYSTRKGAGSGKRLGEAYGLRASIHCAVGNRKAASNDAMRAASLGASVKRCTGK
jgi:tetratricopeptide (TPR) repeat protein